MVQPVIKLREDDKILCKSKNSRDYSSFFGLISMGVFCLENY